MKVPLVVIKLLFVGALFIISNYNLHLSVDDERAEFFSLYSIWIDNMVTQGIDVTAYVVKFEWLPPKDPTLLKGSGTTRRGKG